MSSDDTPVCPVCGGTLKYRDTRLRIRKKEGGVKEYLMIRRLRCTECHRHHNELPDCLVPHKHYEAEVISGVLDRIVTSEDADSEDSPSLLTMLRWLQWFRMNFANIEGFLRNTGYRIPDTWLGRRTSFLPCVTARYHTPNTSGLAGAYPPHHLQQRRLFICCTIVMLLHLF